MNDTVEITVTAPAEMIAAAQEIIDSLPRRDWPEDDWYSVGECWDLNAFLNAKRKRCAFLCYVDSGNTRTGQVAKIWEDVQ